VRSRLAGTSVSRATRRRPAWPAARITQVAVVAAAYAALTIYLAPFSYGQLQFRVAEMLKPLVIWQPDLIPAFVIGDFLGNLNSPFAGPWELGWMPLANLLGAWLCWRLGRINAYVGAAAYAVVIAAAVSTMLSVLLRVPILALSPLGGLLPWIMASELLLIVLGVPVMRPVHLALQRIFGERQ
jgi:uncharacterized membrane protein